MQARDASGNPLPTGGTVVIVEATGENNTGPIEATSNNDGTYTANYTPTNKGVAAGTPAR